LLGVGDLLELRGGLWSLRELWRWHVQRQRELLDLPGRLRPLRHLR
jgi:hypothetical protein